MHKIQIGNDIVKEYPETIDEMTPSQFVGFAGLVFAYQTNQLSYLEFSVKLTYLLLDLQRTVKTDHPDIDTITENINKVSLLNEGFFETKLINKKEVKVIKLDFIKSVLPEIKIGKTKYCSPADALFNTQFGEYIIALNSYLDYSNSGEEADLDLLLGALYRPATKDKKYQFKDKRISFNEDYVEYYANEFKTLSFAHKYAVYLWFSACQHFIVTNKSLHLSGGVTIDLTVLFNNSNNKSSKGIGMAGVINSLAESQVFGDAEKTAKENTYTILARMVQTYHQAKELQRNAEN